MPKTREQKSVLLDRLVKSFKSAKSVAFANYQGMTVAQADTLRKKASEAKVEYVVAKKTLFTRAAKDAGFEVNAKEFPGMIGAAFATEDEMASAKVLGDMSKGTPMVLVGGIFDGASVEKEKIIALSKLPGKKELLGMLAATLNGIPAAFVRALNAVREKQEAGAPTPVVEAPKAEAAPVEEPKKEEAPASVPPTAETPAAEATPAAPVEEKPAEAPAAAAEEKPAEPAATV